MVVPEWLAVCVAALMYAYGFLFAWAICHDGKSKFWTGFMDGLTLRLLWRQR